MTEIERVKTGVPGLDALIGGGIPAESVVLVSGAAGTGKTVLVLQFLVEGAKKGERSVYFTFEEREDLRRMLRRKVGGTPQERPHEYEKRSPVYLVSSILCPVLIVHGTRDVQVSFSHATNLLQRMRMKNLPVNVHFYEGLGHHVQGVVHEAVIERICNFLLTQVD